MLFLTGSWVAGGWCASVPRLQNAPDLSFNRVRSSLSVRVFLGLNRTATSSFRVLRQAERFLCHMERVKSMAWVPPVGERGLDLGSCNGCRLVATPFCLLALSSVA